jgi:hypothetical protein
LGLKEIRKILADDQNIFPILEKYFKTTKKGYMTKEQYLHHSGTLVEDLSQNTVKENREPS